MYFQVIQEINDLRKLSIHVVETIVMWRDLFRQIGMLTVSQAKSLKRLQQQRFAFLITSDESYHNNTTENGSRDENHQTLINYLIKMKSDTSHFCTLEIGKFFNFCERNRSDPFLITTGLSQAKNLAVGGGIAAM